MRITNRNGSQMGLWFDDYLSYSSIATVAVDPIATYQASGKANSDLATLNKYIENGFGVTNATDNSGVVYVITWEQFQDYLKKGVTLTPATWSLTGIVPQEVYLASGAWVLTPCVKVFAVNDGTYPSTVTTVNITRIL